MIRLSIIAASLFIAGAAFAGAGAPGHSHGGPDGETAFGKPGNPKLPARVITITMAEGDGTMSFTPSVVEVKKGERVRFLLKNNGELDHELILATLEMNLAHAKEMEKNPDMQHDDPNGKRIAPKKTSEIVWMFSKDGEFDFSCLIPGHREAGMHGKVIVKSATASN